MDADIESMKRIWIPCKSIIALYAMRYLFTVLSGWRMIHLMIPNKVFQATAEHLQPYEPVHRGTRASFL
jgi:hypothetical protein